MRRPAFIPGILLVAAGACAAFAASAARLEAGWCNPRAVFEGTQGSKSGRSKSKAQPHALLFGTVFFESGLLARGATVEVSTVGAGKPRKWSARTDMQGEFAVHLPPGKAVYRVEARLPDTEPASKEASFEGDERQDVVLHLKHRQERK